MIVYNQPNRHGELGATVVEARILIKQRARNLIIIED
jgi:hypothetical protein